MKIYCVKASYDNRRFCWFFLYEKRRIVRNPAKGSLTKKLEGKFDVMDVMSLDTVEQVLEALLNDDSEDSQGALEILHRLEAARSQRQQMEAEAVQPKLQAMLATHPWMVPERIGKILAGITRENASAKSKRKKVIAIANSVTAALEPYVACKPGCSDCCYMNTMIYEHEAVRLAEVTGRKMVNLPYRPLDQVLADGNKFNGKPCPFLVKNKCSVYEERPLVCRTHHSLREDSSQCSMDSAANLIRPPMYDPDILEVPYMELNASYNAAEPWGNIAEFFPDERTL
jgi:Fe-S-cluster containining protein